MSGFYVQDAWLTKVRYTVCGNCTKKKVIGPPNLSLNMCRSKSTGLTNHRHAEISLSTQISWHRFLLYHAKTEFSDDSFILEAAMHTSVSWGRNQKNRPNNPEKLIRFKSAPSSSTLSSTLHWLLSLGTTIV